MLSHDDEMGCIIEGFVQHIPDCGLQRTYRREHHSRVRSHMYNTAGQR
jgi:hypothetical protein